MIIRLSLQSLTCMSLSRSAQFFLCLVAGGLVSVWRRKDMNWDLQNYHFYNPWAFIHERTAYDLAPAQMQSYLNPFLDVPFFLLVNSDVPPIVISFLMGLPVGVAIAFFLCTVRYAVSGLPPMDRNAVTWLSLLVAMTGAAGLPTVGSTMNEWHTTALVMPAVYMAMRLCCEPGGAGDRLKWAGVGLLLGSATGLKLTAGPYPVALAVAALAAMRAPLRDRLANEAMLVLGGLFAFGLSYGYWGYLLTKQFGNPFFPFFNGLFQSPYWFYENLQDVFRPRTVTDAIAFPFRLLERSMISSNHFQRDPRIPLLFVGLIAAATLIVAGKLRLAQTVATRAVAFLSLFTLIAFVVWLIVFAIYRYLIPVELIGSFLLPLLAWRALQAVPWRKTILVAFCAAIIVATDRPGWGRMRFKQGETYFGVQVPTLPSGSLVLLYGLEPLAYVLPYLGTSHRYVRPLSSLTHPSHRHQLQREIAQAIETHRGPMYALRSTDTPVADEALVLEAYRLRITQEACLPLQSAVHPGRLTLCPLARS